MRARVLVSALALALGWHHPAAAQSGDNVLLVVNDRTPVSGRIAAHYALRRSVPPDQVVHLEVDPADEIQRSAYDAQIETPIAKWLGRLSAQDRILYLVLTKGVPLRIAGTAGRNGTGASVDSELALLYRKLTGAVVPILGPQPNPYFLGARPVEQARRFRHRDQDIYLVTRLDAFTEADVIALIDRGSTPTDAGRFVLDGRAGWDDPGNDLLRAAAALLVARGLEGRVTLDVTSTVLGPLRDVLGYYSWGSIDPAVKTRVPNVTFVPGAIGAMFTSADARTFTEPPDGWSIGAWNDKASFYAGSPQSLAGDLVRAGITGIAGQVSEPYLDGAVRPGPLLSAYVSGFNLAESYYLAMPYLSWQTVVIGDPLCTPSPRRALGPSELDPGPDVATALPASFSARRLRFAQASGPDRTPVEALVSLVRSEGCLARNDRSCAVEALETAIRLEPRLAAAQMSLAALYETGGDYAKAVERYRAILQSSPNHLAALNNLAYALAARLQKPDEALAFAERAIALAPGHASIADTLAWTHHLLGHQSEALALLRQAVKLQPANAEIRFHLAAVLAAIGEEAEARTELAQALALAPDLAEREEVKALRTKIGGPGQVCAISSAASAG